VLYNYAGTQSGSLPTVTIDWTTALLDWL